MIPVSVCIIAKNEEKHIEECLRRLSFYDWEIVVVDTGSTDHTVEIAQKYTNNVYSFDWINDFSAAKNYAVSLAGNNHILIVDCDEYLERNEQTDYIISHLPEQITPEQIGLVHLISPSNDLSAAVLASGKLSESSPVVHDYIARFFHREYTHFKGSVHEQLIPLQKRKSDFISLPLTFYHEGYRTISTKKEKAARNIYLLEAELKKKGDDPYILFQLGQTYFGLSDYSHALPYFNRAISMEVNEQETYVQILIESYGYCLLYLKQYSKALELEGVYSVFSHRADFVFLMGLIYMNNAMFDAAVSEFLKATSIHNYSVEGVNSYKAYYNIGVIYECQNKKDDALKYYRQCINYEPAIDRICLLERK